MEKTSDQSVQKLPMEALKRDNAIQSRIQTNPAVIKEYKDLLIDGDIKLPPIDVFQDGSVYRVVDGIHRLIAANEAGKLEIECRIHQGGETAAILFAAGANSRHGLRRTAEDIEKSIDMIKNLSDGVARSERDIAKIVGVHHSRVNRYLKKLSHCDSSGVDSPKRFVERKNPIPNTSDPDDPDSDYSEGDFQADEQRAAFESLNEENVELKRRLALSFCDAPEEEKKRLVNSVTELEERLKETEATLNIRLNELSHACVERNDAISRVKKLQQVVKRKDEELSECKRELESAQRKIDDLKSSLDYYEALESARNG